RNVRIDAGWALRAVVDTNTLAGRDLLAHMQYNTDQPSGALQIGVFCLDRGEVAEARRHFSRALAWDTNSAPIHHAMAVALSMEGKPNEAVASLRVACRLAPGDPEYQYKLGLALNECGKMTEAMSALEQAVKIEPRYARAWYNLGLAYNASGRSDEAVDTLLRAEALDGVSAQIPYARATILARLGRVREARAAAQRALELQPGYPEALGLLAALPGS
ncbi:MAG TPA: tetratricopeptide repeat protein, partial [Clostridia bacterium]|nr:tetratricopeptide repeat protein [Clostridia bacterium]